MLTLLSALGLAAPPEHWADLPQSTSMALEVDTPHPAFPDGTGKVDEVCRVAFLVSPDGTHHGHGVTGCSEPYASAVEAVIPGWSLGEKDLDTAVLNGTVVHFTRTRRGKESVEVRSGSPSTRLPGHDRLPTYPQEAMALDTSRLRCHVELEVDGQGVPVWLEYVMCPDLLRPAVTEAAAAWRYLPVEIEGSPQAYTVRVPIIFQLVGAPTRELWTTPTFPAPPAYPDDAPAAETLPWVAAADLVALAPLTFSASDLREARPGEGATCSAILYIDGTGRTFHADVSYCPEHLQLMTYEALVARPFEPVTIDGEVTGARAHARFSYGL